MNSAARVVIATDTTVPDGVDRHVVDLAMAARAMGVAVTVLLETAAGPGLATALTRRDIPILSRRLHHGTHAAGDIISDCDRAITEVKPHLLHVVCGSPRSCLTLREAAGRADISVVLTEQYVPDGLIYPAETLSRIARSYRSAEHVIFVSDGNRAEMSRVIPDATRRARVIPNAVAAMSIASRCPTSRERRERAVVRRAAGALRVICVARLAPQKGIEMLLRAVHLLGQDAGITVDVYGTGFLHSTLLAERDDLDLRESVQFAGWCDDVTAELASHDLFVLPSRHEGMPFAVLEAMAGGIPVIATDVRGTVEALGGGALGTVVPSDDPVRLANALAAFRENPDAALDLAQDASVHVIAHHDVDDCMERTLECWRATLSKEVPSSTC